MEQVHLDPREVDFGASNFTTMLGGKDWRVYYITAGGSEGWLLRITGADAEVKAKAIAMILNGHD
jgi:hypothetical protein